MYINSRVEQHKTLNNISCLYSKYLKSNIKQHKNLKESNDLKNIFNGLFYVEGDSLLKNLLIEESGPFSYKYNYIKSNITKTIKIEKTISLSDSVWYNYVESNSKENVKISLDESVKYNNIIQGVNKYEGLTTTTIEYNYLFNKLFAVKE